MASFLAEPQPVPTLLTEITELDDELGRLQHLDRERAEARGLLEAHLLERHHFRNHLAGLELPDVTRLNLVKGPSHRILDFLAETEAPPRPQGAVRRLIQKLRIRLAYGPLRGLRASDTAVALALQDAYYDLKIAELGHQISAADDVLLEARFADLAEEHHRKSEDYLRTVLRARYSGMPRRSYGPRDLNEGSSHFTDEYPVILSTCHSIRQSVPKGRLLDYLIIDEASQVDLLAAGLALSVCRNLVVVGDLQQLAHITDRTARQVSRRAPLPAYEYTTQNILSSVIELHGDGLPRTLLREHYRCAPEIIGFCNKKFYDGALIPYTRPDPSVQPLMVVRTAEGNHMRRGGDGGGRSNQREVDVITTEVIPTYFADAASESIGITTPFNLQVEILAASVHQQTQSDTVHKFQGREKDIIIMSAVLDESADGRASLSFVDDPRMVNVAVSRAIKQFVLVTNHGLLPESHHLRDLIGYIRYHQPDRPVVDSRIVSVFDLLYGKYSERLQDLADRVVEKSGFRSEDIIWAVLTEVLSEERYSHLSVVGHVLLRTLVPRGTMLRPRQTEFVNQRASIDLVVFNKVTNAAVLTLEVDGHAFHAADPVQLERDAVKDSVLAAAGLPLLRLSTTGHGEEQRIRQMLDAALAPSQRIPGR